MDRLTKILKKNEVFQGLTDAQLEALIPYIRKRALAEGSYLFHEGDTGESFFVIEGGSIAILKKDPSLEQEISLIQLHMGEIIGEMASLGGGHRTTSAKALTATHLLELSLEELARYPQVREIYLHLKTKLSKALTQRVISSNNALVAGYKKQLEHEKARAALGDFIAHLMILLFLYIFAIKLISVLKIQAVSTTVISIPVLLVFGAAMLHMMKKSGCPWSMYGFTLKGSVRALIESFFLSLPVFGIVVLYKWIIIQIDPAFYNFSLFHVTAGLNPDTTKQVSYFVIALLLLGYAVFVPVQEIIYRGAMQNILEKFLIGKNKTILAILISNFPFSLIHIHVSLVLTVLVYFLGVFWGWLFARQRTLVGCTFSHFLVGIWAFFIVGISDILQM